MPHIEIIVSPTGQTQVRTQQFEGTACRAGSFFLERALGVQTGEQLTSEFYQVQVSSEGRESERT